MPLSPHCRGEVKNINREKQRKNIKKYICLFLFIDILLLISSMLATAKLELQIVSFRAHLITIIIGKRGKWGAEVKA